MRRRQFDFFLLVLFYLNILVYIGGDIFWKYVDQPTVTWNFSTSSDLSLYDSFIRKYAQRYGLDWRFVYSMIETESSFRPNVISSAGAIGLMQVLPAVAIQEGVLDIKDPEENIRVGVKHLKRYFDVLKGETSEDTLRINLAAYNAGIAHIKDAQRLAFLLGMNPKQWKSLEKTLPLLEMEDFQPFLNYGFCQGNSVVAYVQRVFKRYQHYRVARPDFPLEIKQL